MSTNTEVRAHLELPETIRRQLRTGETIWHSRSACHVSAKFPDGKWLGKVRRRVNGKITNYPVKGFGSPQEALAHVKSFRPDAAGRATVKRPGEPTVAELYEYVRTHGWKKLSESRKRTKAARWRNYIAPYWGSWALSEVTRRKAQEWITDTEALILSGKIEAKGTNGQKLGIPQFNEIRTDLSQLFDRATDLDEAYGERRNPFDDLSFEEAPKRALVTIESAYFAPILDISFELARLELVTPWIVEMFATSLLAGLREAEVLALMANRIDWNKKIITVDRAMRQYAQDVDDETGLPEGPVKSVALGLPKNEKTRIVPISAQLEEVLRPAWERANRSCPRPFLWASSAGTMREKTLFQKAFKVLRGRLDNLAELRDIRWKRFNQLVAELKEDETRRLPKLFGRLKFRDTRNSFASYSNEVRVTQATRELILGHARGVTNVRYTVATGKALDDARVRLSNGWDWNLSTLRASAA